MGRNLIFLVVVGILFLVILFLKEFGLLKKLRYKVFQRVDQVVEAVPNVALDSDVQEEIVRVRNMSMEEIKEANMVMMDMVKVYGKFHAVKGVSVAVKE